LITVLAKRYRDLWVAANPEGMHNAAFSERCVSYGSKWRGMAPAFKECDVKLAMSLEEVLQESLNNIDCVEKLKAT
jgi:hypothetical protein